MAVHQQEWVLLHPWPDNTPVTADCACDHCADKRKRFYTRKNDGSPLDVFRT